MWDALVLDMIYLLKSNGSKMNSEASKFSGFCIISVYLMSREHVQGLSSLCKKLNKTL
mgnify:CR=1 FL=1